MSLQARLTEIWESAEKRLPADKRAIMRRATQSLRDSGIMQRVIKVGDRLPDFVLANANGAMIGSKDLLARGTVVLSVFRGHW